MNTIELPTFVMRCAAWLLVIIGTAIILSTASAEKEGDLPQPWWITFVGACLVLSGIYALNVVMKLP